MSVYVCRSHPEQRVTWRGRGCPTCAHTIGGKVQCRIRRAEHERASAESIEGWRWDR